MKIKLTINAVCEIDEVYQVSREDYKYFHNEFQRITEEYYNDGDNYFFQEQFNELYEWLDHNCTSEKITFTKNLGDEVSFISLD